FVLTLLRAVGGNEHGGVRQILRHSTGLLAGAGAAGRLAGGQVPPAAADDRRAGTVRDDDAAGVPAGPRRENVRRRTRHLRHLLGLLADRDRRTRAGAAAQAE